MISCGGLGTCSTRVDDLVKNGTFVFKSFDRTDVSKLFTKLVIFLNGFRRRTGDAKSSSSSASLISAISGFPRLGEDGINDFSLHFWVAGDSKQLLKGRSLLFVGRWNSMMAQIDNQLCLCQKEDSQCAGGKTKAPGQK